METQYVDAGSILDDVQSGGSKQDVAVRIEDLVANFDHYLEVFRRLNPFTSEQLRHHRDTAERRTQLGGAQAAVGNPEFLSSLYSTLESWGMNSRGAALVPFGSFVGRWNHFTNEIESLERFRIGKLNSDGRSVRKRLWALIDALEITATESRVVAGTKALHHLLPELVPPMDRAYTAPFFGWGNRVQGREAEFFEVAFCGYAEIAESVGPLNREGSGWDTSLTKVLDNAVVGYCKTHLLDQRSQQKMLIARAKEMGVYDEIVARVDAQFPSSRRRRPT